MEAHLSFDVDDYLDKASQQALIREINTRASAGEHILDELIDDADIIDAADTEELIAELESRGYQVLSEEELSISPREWLYLAECIAEGDKVEALYFMESLNFKLLSAGVVLNRFTCFNSKEVTP